MEESAANRSQQEVLPGDLIWVQLNGSSWWPAQVVDDNSVSEESKPGKRSTGEVLVRIYGSYIYLYVDPIKCHSEFEKILEQNNGSHKEIFEKALEQDLHRLRKGKSKRRGQKSKANVGVDVSKDKKNQKRVKKDKEVEASTDTMDTSLKSLADSIRKIRALRADLDAKISKDIVSEKEGRTLRSAKKINVVDAGLSIRVSPRRQSSAEAPQDGTPKRLKRKGPSTDEQETSEHNKVHKKPKKDSPSTEIGSKRKSSKQSAAQKKHKDTSHGARTKSKNSKKDEKQKELVSCSPSTEEEDTQAKSPKQDKVTTKAGKSPALSERRMRVMQSLGLIPPDGSPFGKN